MTAPCHCPAHDPECFRAGRNMTLRDWELCSGNCPVERPCSPEESTAYRARWDGEESVACRDCKHLGKRVGAESCQSCCGNVRIKVFACAVHGTATIRKPIEGHATCPCDQFEAAQ